MRTACVMLILGLSLAACGGGERTVVVPQSPAAATVIVPQGATVICPGGGPAVQSGNTYRC